MDHKHTWPIYDCTVFYNHAITVLDQAQNVQPYALNSLSSNFEKQGENLHRAQVKVKHLPFTTTFFQTFKLYTGNVSYIKHQFQYRLVLNTMFLFYKAQSLIKLEETDERNKIHQQKSKHNQTWPSQLPFTHRTELIEG